MRYPSAQQYERKVEGRPARLFHGEASCSCKGGSGDSQVSVMAQTDESS